MAYEFVSVEKTPSLARRRQYGALARKASMLGARGVVGAGCTHSLEFSNCARTAMASVVAVCVSSRIVEVVVSVVESRVASVCEERVVVGVVGV